MASMDSARAFFRIIKENLNAVPDEHAQITHLHGEMRTQLSNQQYQGIRDLSVRLEAEHLAVQSGITNTHAMVIKIISIFTEP